MDLVTGATGSVGGRLVTRLEAPPLDGGSHRVQAAILGNLVRCGAGRMRSLAPVALPGSGP